MATLTTSNWCTLFCHYMTTSPPTGSGFLPNTAFLSATTSSLPFPFSHNLLPPLSPLPPSALCSHCNLCINLLNLDFFYLFLGFYVFSCSSLPPLTGQPSVLLPFKALTNLGIGRVCLVLGRSRIRTRDRCSSSNKIPLLFSPTV